MSSVFGQNRHLKFDWIYLSIFEKFVKIRPQWKSDLSRQALLSPRGPEGEVLDQDLPPEHRPRRQRLPQHPQRGLEARDEDLIQCALHTYICFLELTYSTKFRIEFLSTFT